MSRRVFTVATLRAHLKKQGPRSAFQLAEDFGCSMKTVRRFLRTLGPKDRIYSFQDYCRTKRAWCRHWTTDKKKKSVSRWGGW